ncbi:hypothetical protein CEE69_03825 [Rhodopirellula bahusiensis]|uniref:Uncharacterized protein n=1 Tax=Rhodopirellula bahusiensis TaxID=2014065 RepID=A0A2G1WBY7_9BACT|nr:hypothetical protein CEE69_03825 [Rhodopirellula bahusiensis]
MHRYPSLRKPNARVGIGRARLGWSNVVRAYAKEGPIFGFPVTLSFAKSDLQATLQPCSRPILL